MQKSDAPRRRTPAGKYLVKAWLSPEAAAWIDHYAAQHEVTPSDAVSAIIENLQRNA